MKQAVLLSLAALLSASVFAQRVTNITAQAKLSRSSVINALPKAGAKSTTFVDTLYNIAVTDSVDLYTSASTTDSGYLFGTNIYGDKGFAERYDINGSDSTVQVTGLIVLFGGTVNPGSTNTVNLKVWSKSAAVPTTDPNIFYNGFPETVLASQSVPVTNLGTSSAGDSAKYFLFNTPTSYLNDTFYAGYDINYTFGNGDTIGLWSSQLGDRISPEYTVSGTDTIINVQNAVQFNSGGDTLWNDVATTNGGLLTNLYVFPIVNVNFTASVKGITKNNLTFYGNYPNPAINETNITFSLASATDVTITITDANGRVINTITQPGLVAGSHTIPVQTSGYAAGNYIYLIRTGTGSGIASKFSVIR